MCLWNRYSNEKVTENMVKSVSIYERENHTGSCLFWAFVEFVIAVVQLHLDVDAHC